MSESRGNWYLVTGVIIGLALGVFIAWVLSPVKYVDTEPASLSDSYKDAYRRVVALAYQTDHDVVRARERLKLLDQASPVQALAAQAQRMIAAKQSAQEARALAVLAADLGRPLSAATPASQTVVAAQDKTATVEPSPFATVAVNGAISTPTLPLPTPSLTVTLTPRPTFTLRPTSTVLSTLPAPFVLKNKRTICDGTIRPGLLQITVMGPDQKPMPGVRIQITWKDGDEIFYTGLTPEISPGYADFLMKSGSQYTLKIGEVSKPVENLEVPGCGGGWDIEFQSEG